MNKKMAFFLTLTLFLHACSSVSNKQSLELSEKCFNYEPEEVYLEGELYNRSFPGPPNYEDIRKGDEEEIYWFIKSIKPFCVHPSNQLYGEKLYNQSEVQLSISSKSNFYKTKRFLLNKKVTVKGTLFPQMTGHHKTEVLINVKKIEKVLE